MEIDDDLVEVLGDDHDGDALARLFTEPVVDVAGRSDIDAPGGLRDQKHLRVARELAGEDELLDVAAREVAGGCVDARGAHVERRYELLARARIEPRRRNPRWTNAGLSESTSMRFSATLKSPMTPSRILSSGT